jgi:hypothetical protein
MTKKKQTKLRSRAGRPRIGQPISITVTDEQHAWLISRIPPAGTLTAVVRDLIERARKEETP